MPGPPAPRVRRLWAAGLLALVAACQGTGGGTRPAELAPGERPAPESDEAGLWAAADRSEKAVRESGRVLRDAAIHDYVTDIVCRLVGEHCNGLRVDVIRTPSFNATMSPNGHMQVWTGLLLRAANEDQLAFVLGHEAAHYLGRHSLERWRAIRATTDATSFFQILTAAAGVPVVGQLGTYAALGGIMAYSRDHEREADARGLELLARAGYDPREATRIWEALLAEREAESKPEASVFFATHPSAGERVDNLRAQAAALSVPAASPSTSRHRAVLDPHVEAWLGDELRKREHAANLVLLDHLEENGQPAGLLAYFRGEVYRLRAGEGDDGRAVSAYREALALGEARAAFETYLAEAPGAEDRAMIASYLDRIGD